MTKLLLTLRVVTVSATFATSVSAYSTEPAAGLVHQTALRGAPEINLAEVPETCNVKVTPDIAQLIGLDPNWRTASDVTTALACAEE